MDPLYEHTPESLNELAKEIQTLGYDAETAGRYAVLIGDTPIRDEDGYTLVYSDPGPGQGGTLLAKLKLKF